MSYDVMLVTDYVKHGKYIIPQAYNFVNHSYGGFHDLNKIFHKRFGRDIWDYLYYAGNRSIEDTIIPATFQDSQEEFLKKCIILLAEVLKGEIKVFKEFKEYAISWILNYIKWILNGYIIVYYQ